MKLKLILASIIGLLIPTPSITPIFADGLTIGNSMQDIKPLLQTTLKAPKKAKELAWLPTTTIGFASFTAPSSRSSYNTYDYGYCTAWAKDRLGWVRNGWGDASNWGYAAKNEGFTVSKNPKVNAVAWTTAGGAGHVAVVEKINGSKVYVSEKNYQGWNVLSYRWTQASHWTGFIY